jgi:hypothetical protein
VEHKEKIMPTYEITAPDGNVYEVTAPDGASEQEVLSYAKQNYKIEEDTATRMNTVEGATRGALQGATFGFGDEIVAGVGALPLAAITGKNVSESYNELLNQERGRVGQFREEKPITAIASEIGGSLGTGIAGLGTKAGAAVARTIGSGGLPARIGKGAIAGSASGGLYGLGTGEEGQRLESAGQGVVLGGAFGGAVPAAGSLVKSSAGGLKNAYKGFKARDVEQLQVASDLIKQKSQNAYQAMRESGAILKPQSAANVYRNMQDALTSEKLNPRLHDKVIGLMEDMKEEVLKGDITVEGFDQWRQLFGEVAGNFTDKVNARKARQIMSAMDDAITSVKPDDIITNDPNAITALQTARAEWARKSKFDSISDIVKKSEGDANYLKRELKKFVNNPKKTRGFTKEELNALNLAATQTAGESILKTLGKFGFDLGSSLSVGNTALPVIGGVLGSPALTAVGTAARQGQKLIARGKAEDVLRLIEQGGNPQQLLMQLPPKEANKVMTVIQNSNILDKVR